MCDTIKRSVKSLFDKIWRDFMRVNATEYPKSLSWEMKSFSMPNIPRGTLGMKENLKIILEMVRNNVSPSQRLIIEGSESKIDLGTACIRLRPMKLLLKTQIGWVLSDEAQRWLDTDDDLYLTAFLCARIKFLAEVLYYLDEPKTAAGTCRISRVFTSVFPDRFGKGICKEYRNCQTNKAGLFV